MTISAVATDLVSKSTAKDDKSTLGSDKNTFLNLLTQQLKFQDPLSPTDTDKFTQQLVQYSQVEQQIKTNEKLDAITKLNVSNKFQNALSIVGQDVKFGKDTFDYTSGSSSKVTYNLAAEAVSSTITVTDSSGATVYEGAGVASKGDHTFSWDGTQNDGNPAATGTYNIKVSAKDKDGKDITTTTTTWSKVISAEAGDTDINLKTEGGSTIKLDDVSVVQAHSVQPTTTQNTGGSNTGL